MRLTTEFKVEGFEGSAGGSDEDVEVGVVVAIEGTVVVRRFGTDDMFADEDRAIRIVFRLANGDRSRNSP